MSLKTPMTLHLEILHFDSRLCLSLDPCLESGNSNFNRIREIGFLSRTRLLGTSPLPFNHAGQRDQRALSRWRESIRPAPL